MISFDLFSIVIFPKEGILEQSLGVIFKMMLGSHMLYAGQSETEHEISIQNHA